MTKRTMMLIGLAAVSLCATGIHARSATPGPECGHHRSMRGGAGGGGKLIHLLLRSTDLTPDQQAQVQPILDADRTAAQGLFTQLRQAHADLANLLLSTQDVKPDALAAQQAVIAQLQQQLAQQEASTVLAIRAVLTPDQLAKANATLSQIEARHADQPHFFGHGH